MTSFIASLNQDSAGRLTSAEYGDVGDGDNGWHSVTRTADGGSVALGATDDTAVTDSAANASAVALLKGLVSLLDASDKTTVSTTAEAASLVVSASAGTLHRLEGYSTTAQYLQLHDAASLPADTAVPVLSIPIASGERFSIDLDGLNFAFTTGIVVANSTTGPTLTTGAADTFITAVYS